MKMKVVMNNMGSHSNYKNKQQNNKNNIDMTKRGMNIHSKEEMDKDFEEKIIDWTTFYR